MEIASGSLCLDRVVIGALPEISLTVAPGEVVCLSGPSGIGKSRLLRAVADIEAHEGVASLGGTEQCDVPGNLWRRAVMMVPAESQWWCDRIGDHFPGDCLENPPVDVTGRLPDIASSLRDLGLDASVMEWAASRLSSGEKQRLALLRALAWRPVALLLDEPTSNLDPERVLAVERWLLVTIRERQLPALWVTHDPAQVQRIADRHFRISGHGLESSL